MITKENIINAEDHQKIIKSIDLFANIYSLKKLKGICNNITTSYLSMNKKTFEYMICVDEVFSNCIVHAYKGIPGIVNIRMMLQGDYLITKIRDYGTGIACRYTKEISDISDENILKSYGRGLFIVDNLSSKLFIERPTDGGTEVVFYFERV